jgi:hypothetical protein
MENSSKSIQMIVFLSSIPVNRENYKSTGKTAVGYNSGYNLNIKATTLPGIICDQDTINNIVRKDPNGKFQNIKSIHDYIFA